MEDQDSKDIGRDTTHPILILGAGFLGSWYIRFLSQRLFATEGNIPLTIVDDGNFEGRNLMAQFVYPWQNEHQKVDVAALTAGNFRLRVNPVRERFTAASDFEAQLVVDCLDNIESRFLAHQFAKSKDVPVLHLSISPSGFGLVEWDDKWSLNPTKQLAPVSFEQVEIDPCELIRYQELGVRIAVRAAVATHEFLASGERNSWHITDLETSKL